MQGTLICLSLALFVSVPAPAYAYIDPSAGQSLIQILVAVVATGGIFFKLGFKRIAKFFSLSSADDKNAAGDR